MDVMYKVKPIFGEEDIVLPDNMYYVKPIADFGSSNSGFLCDSISTQVPEPKSTNQSNKKAENSKETMNKENKKSDENMDTSAKTPGNKSEVKDKKQGEKSKKGKKRLNSENQSNPDQSISKETSDGNTGNQGDKNEGGKEGETRPIIPTLDTYLGNIIGDVVVQDFSIQVDFDYKPLRVLKVINHLRKNFGLRIAVKVYISSTVLVESETNVDEWRMFETFESTILPRQDNQLFVTLIVRRFTPEEAWLNKQPFMIFDPSLGTAVYGEVNIARHITRAAQVFWPPICSIYPENDPDQAATVKDIDDTLNEIQKFLFTRSLQDKQARPQIPEIKDRRLKDNNDLDVKFTLDYILLLSLKL